MRIVSLVLYKAPPQTRFSDLKSSTLNRTNSAFLRPEHIASASIQAFSNCPFSVRMVSRPSSCSSDNTVFSRTGWFTGDSIFLMIERKSLNSGSSSKIDSTKLLNEDIADLIRRTRDGELPFSLMSQFWNDTRSLLLTSTKFLFPRFFMQYTKKISRSFSYPRIVPALLCNDCK